MSARSRPRTHRAHIEEQVIKKREKQFQHDELWGGQKKYYENWEKKNAKFEEWTSPRYHDQHKKFLEKLKKERDKEENLQKRREKLRKLLNDEEQAEEIELMIRKSEKFKTISSPRPDEVSIDVLKELNKGLRLEERERRRHEAELKLYHQWRSENPVLRHYERLNKNRDLKMSWLDQQVENRMRKEQEEEECRKVLKERDLMIKKEEERYEEEKARNERKRLELKRMLDEQMEELRVKSKITDELKRKEDEEMVKKLQLYDLEKERCEEENKRGVMECALFNIKHYKLRLKKKCEDIERNLDEERKLISKLRDLEVADRIKDELKKNEIKNAIVSFLVINKEQKELERKRLKHLDFLFDSEAKSQFEQQIVIWREEEQARMKLLKDVLDTVKQQIDENLERNKEKQREMLKESEEMLERIEEYNHEIEEIQKEEQEKTREWKKLLNEDLKLKTIKKKVSENMELKKVNEELENVRKEEERLKQEILKMQRKQTPIRPHQRNILF